MAMGHVILKEFYFNKRSAYFDNYVRRYTDMPNLVQLEERTLPDGRHVMVPGRYLRASDVGGQFGQSNNPDWKTLALDQNDAMVLPNGSIGFRWGPPSATTSANGTSKTRKPRAAPKCNSSSA